jgi:NitT/TauT family transport system substrate-binding protein
MMMMSKPLGVLAALAIVLQAGASLAADKVAFQLDWTPGGISSAYYLGAAKGCFSDQDIDITISRGYGAADAVTKVATGVADFSVTDLGTIIGTIAETKAPVKAIVPIVSISPMGLAVLDDSPIKTMKDLEGHSVGSSVGNAAMLYMPTGVELDGGDYSKVTPITADGAALNGLLLQGKIDSLASYVTSTVQLQSIAKASGLVVRSILFGDKLDIYNASVFTSDKMIADKPDLVARFAKGVECSYDAAAADPTAAIDAITAGVEGMVRDTQLEAVPFAMDFAFNNAVFKKNGYKWDMARVDHNIELVNKANGKTNELKAADVVYAPAAE